MVTQTGRTGDQTDLPDGYDPSKFPLFAVTVDVVILSVVDGELRVLLVQRGEAPFRNMWAIPGGFKLPNETLDEAAARELVEETGVASGALLTQFGAYGDPGRDPRMNVVTVAYLAVVQDVGTIVSGSDAAHAALMPVSAVLHGSIKLAFDHERIVSDALERVRHELDTSGLATRSMFTLSELRTVHEAIWGMQLDGANFRRSVVADDGWVIPTGRRARSGSAAGKPAELFRAGTAWRHAGPSRRPEPTSTPDDHIAGGPANAKQSKSSSIETASNKTCSTKSIRAAKARTERDDPS